MPPSSNTKVIKLIECPRDAMQGIHDFIPTAKKIEYINALLNVGFDTIDFGSFVSAKAIPQMADTKEVLKGLNLSTTKSKLLAIVANVRGAEEASVYDEITYLGFPFSISETFQLRNTNSTIAQSLKTVDEINTICAKKNKELVIYISMGFGNPYGDEWNSDIANHWVAEMVKRNIKIISLADTVGVATPDSISYLFKNVVPEFPKVEFGAHLHTTPGTWHEKVDAAYTNGCLRFDGALKGYGGCPMAQDALVGNMPTENLISYLKDKNKSLSLSEEAFNKAMKLTSDIFI
jgi:hydroxymethylglutaryl-CoA lyase